MVIDSLYKKMRSQYVRMHKPFQVQFSPITPGYSLFELLPCNIFAKTAIRYIQGLPEARLLKSVVVPFWKGRA